MQNIVYSTNRQISTSSNKFEAKGHWGSTVNLFVSLRGGALLTGGPLYVCAIEPLSRRVNGVGLGSFHLRFTKQQTLHASRHANGFPGFQEIHKRLPINSGEN
jgi:hypothetical protein